MLDDALHGAVIGTDDATVADGIRHLYGEQRDAIAGAIQQRLQGLGRDQRHVTAEDQYRPFV